MQQNADFVGVVAGFWPEEGECAQYLLTEAQTYGGFVVDQAE